MTTDAEPEIRRPRRSLRRRWREWWSVRAWRRRWTWFLDLFRNPFRRRDRVERPTLPVPEPLPAKSSSFIVAPPKLRPFRTPAKGDGFTFEVQANVVWEGNVSDDSERNLRASEERVREAIEKRQKTIQQELMTAIRPIARSYPAFQAAELEQHLVQVLPDLLSTRMNVAKPTNADSTDGRVDEHRSRGIHVSSNDGYRMEVFLWVDSCPEIRHLQQQVWTSVTIAAGKGTLSHQRLHERDALQRAWKDLLTTLLTSMGVRDPNQARWTELLALQLAQSDAPEDAAKVVVEQIMERHDQAKQLHSDLADYLWAADGSDTRIRTMDFALGSDAALTRILDVLGVPDLSDTRKEGLAGEDTEQ